MSTVPQPLETPDGNQLVAGTHLGRTTPPSVPARDDSLESDEAWGFGDTSFEMLPDGNVRLTGDRYDLSGLILPGVGPWMGEQLGIPFDPADVHAPHYPPKIAEPVTNPAFLEALLDLFATDAVSVDPEVRLRHGHGHTQEEMYAIRYGGDLGRIPDVVVYPTSQGQVEALVALAAEHGVSLVPYGGGTNVSGALRAPQDEQRLIVSVDLGRLNQVLWVDPANRMACIQAGAVGRDIIEQLAAYGYTMGHEPDSLEFSTLGGWIATHASGMKKNRYGNIEDLVIDMTVVTAQGTLTQSALPPRESIGLDARRWIFGSEGTLGIVTSAVVKIFPLPEVQEYDAIIFRDFAAGTAFMYDMQRAGAAPASLRLMDSVQFQMGQTLKPASTGGIAKAMSNFEKWFVTKFKGFDPDRMAACTLVFEGSRAQVAAQQKIAKRLAKRHGGLGGGASNGERGYQLTFSIAYLRDFVMEHWILAESFETSIPWSEAPALCETVKRRIQEEHAARDLPGTPFISYRMTQVYETGVCIYFYFGMVYKGVDDPTAVYNELEHIAREVILDGGGSLSHHHGIGKHRQDFLPRVVSKATLACNTALKQAVDPGDVFGIRNQHVDVE